jgi:hypothetical protein
MHIFTSLKNNMGRRVPVISALAAMSLAGCSVNPIPAEAGNPSCCNDALQPPLAEQLVGVWEPMGNPRDLDSEADPVYTPEIQKSIDRQIKLRAAGDITGDYSALCIPPAMPTMVTLGPQEILLDDKKITWIMEATSGIRWIWLDGRDHPDLEELRLTVNGHSIGWWEGDELVIDTVGFMDKAMVYVNLPGNVSIYPSPQMRVVERLRLIDDGQAFVSDRIIYDPVSLALPWKTTVRYERRDWEIGETVCMENNQLDFYFDMENLVE